MTFTSIYVYTAELFHTPVRHLAVGTSSTMARIGSMLAPFVGEPLASDNIMWQFNKPHQVFRTSEMFCKS